MKFRLGGWGGKKNLYCKILMMKKTVCVCDLLFLALKQRYRLLPVFGNMIVNNGWASLLFEISRY